ncbi:MAG: hypothetical protein KZQ83_03825 [gamma proteobacterium symbiont of Taylorina sp.]|nr:hypothetical protein [gamma proteobacterium symbiont of Taylorina sp.]
MKLIKKKLNKFIIALTILLFSQYLPAEDNKRKPINITPSQVYKETLKLHAEIDMISDSFNLIGSHLLIEKNVSIAGSDIKPRHVWQLAYILMVKVNLLRVKYGLPRIEEVGMEPVFDINPNLPYGQLKRLLTELRIIKDFFGITQTIPQIQDVTGKKPEDVYKQLLFLSLELNYLNQQPITASSTFAQVMRLYKDITPVFQVLNINDNTSPPAKQKYSSAEDTFNNVQKFMIQLKKLQRLADIETTSFSFLRKKEITPEETFIFISMAIAEFQTIKAYLGLTHMITPPAEFYQQKTAADVEQLMQWTTRRLNLMTDLEIFNAE